jgi:ABC-2 type transport system ATP-binding protein
MIRVAHLTKTFSNTVAIDDLSFEVKRGEIVGFLGPNGAGKTTTMRILSCFLPATGGKVEVGGMDVFSESLEVRRRIGYLPEQVALYNDMRVNEYLSFRARLKGMRGRKLDLAVDEVLSCCGLQDVRRRVIGRLSRGYRQRIGLADSLVHRPDLLILDEPTMGLDPNQIRQMRNLIKSLGRRHTILLSSHILPEVELICERVLIINKGRIVASDTPLNLVEVMKGNPQVRVEVRGDKDRIRDALQGIPGVVNVSWQNMGEWEQFICSCEKDLDIRQRIFSAAMEHRWVLRELSAERKTLEDVFFALTMDDPGKAP